MVNTECFWVEDTGRCRIVLRRLVFSPYCSATKDVGEATSVRSDDGYLTFISPEEYRNSDWPRICDRCGKDLGPVGEHEWAGISCTDAGVVNAQVNQETLYRAQDGREWPQRSLPPGAMFDAFWSRERGVGADGIALTVVVPYTGGDARNGFWHVDGPATDGGHWTRTGDPRVPGSVTANPSILIKGMYHGFLRSGVLVPC